MPNLNEALCDRDAGLPSYQGARLLLYVLKQHILNRLLLSRLELLLRLLLHHNLITSSVAHLLEVTCHHSDGSYGDSRILKASGHGPRRRRVAFHSREWKERSQISRFAFRSRSLSNRRDDERLYL